MCRRIIAKFELFSHLAHYELFTFTKLKTLTQHYTSQMKTFIYKLSLFALLAQIGHANQAQKLLTATADASVRKDRQYENYGDARHITVTKDSAKNARVALLKFDTADVATEATKALLRIYIADVDGVSEERTVLIRSVNDNFDEDHVTWDNYDVHEESAGWIEFHVHNEHVGMLGQVDVSMLMVPGENLNLAIHTSDKGHVKFASKENEDASAHPKLLLLKEL